MEDFVQAVGVVGFILLAATGLLAGWVASLASGGRHRPRYLLIGLVGALAAPLVLIALGVTVLAASGLVAVLAAALVGAVIVLVIARLIFD